MNCKQEINRTFVVWGNPCLYLKSLRSPFLRVPLYYAPWKKDEIVMAIKLFLGIRDYNKRNYIFQLEKTIKNKFKSPNILLFSSGREAIKFALELINLKNNEEVILPSLACTSLLEPILDLKGKPIFADIDENLNIDPKDVENKISSKTKAIIVPHLYGKAAQIEKLSEISKKRKIFLIDDAAQAPGIRYKDRYLGTWGDFGILSFGFGKPIFGIGGGALIINNEVFLSLAKNEYQKLSQEDESEACKRAWKILIKGKFRSISFAPFLLKRCLSFEKESNYNLLISQSNNIIPKKISNISAFYALKAIYHLDVKINICLNYAKYLFQKIKKLKIIKTPYYNFENQFFWRFPIFINSSINGNNFLSFLYKYGIEIEPTYTPLHFKTSKHDKLQNTEFVYDKIFLLSLCTKITPNKIDFIYKVLNKYEKKYLN